MAQAYTKNVRNASGQFWCTLPPMPPSGTYKTVEPCIRWCVVTARYVLLGQVVRSELAGEFVVRRRMVA